MRTPWHLLIIMPLLMMGGCNKTANKQSEITHRLAINVRNATQRVLYTTCFSYIKLEGAPRWKWIKSPVHAINPKTEAAISIANFKRKDGLKNAYGVLGVFTDRDAAEKAIYELTPDANKIDLDKLHNLKDQTIVVGVEKYGIVGDIFDYNFIPSNMQIPAVPELDFSVENQTGRPLYATAFVYQRKESMTTWQYDKTPIIHIKNGESGVIDVDTLTDPYDRKYVRGYLAIFDENEKKAAEDSIFQTLQDHQKINVGLLSALQGRKVILKHQKYGILGDIIDFTVKAPRKIAFSRHENIKTQPRYTQ